MRGRPRMPSVWRPPPRPRPCFAWASTLPLEGRVAHHVWHRVCQGRAPGCRAARSCCGSDCGRRRVRGAGCRWPGSRRGRGGRRPRRRNGGLSNCPAAASGRCPSRCRRRRCSAPGSGVPRAQARSAARPADAPSSASALRDLSAISSCRGSWPWSRNMASRVRRRKPPRNANAVEQVSPVATASDRLWQEASVIAGRRKAPSPESSRSDHERRALVCFDELSAHTSAGAMGSGLGAARRPGTTASIPVAPPVAVALDVHRQEALVVAPLLVFRQLEFGHRGVGALAVRGRLLHRG